MELRHLRYFVNVAEKLSFSRAALSLRIAQPSLSSQIRDLEEELGLRLLNRDRNHVSLTDAGRVFLTEAKEVLVRADTAVKKAREAAEGKTGELRIGTIGALTLSFLPASLITFRKAFPGVQLTLRELAVHPQFLSLTKGLIHVGFVPTPFPDLAEARKLEKRLLLRSPILVVVNPQHRLAKQKVISLRDLADEKFLYMRMNQSDGHREWTESVCKKAGFQPSFGTAAESAESLASLVATEEGVAIISKLSARPPSPGYTFRPIAESDLEFELFTLWNPAFPSALLDRFLEIVQAEAVTIQRALATENKRRPRSR